MCSGASRKDHGASTIGLYVEESDLTEICDYKVHYDSIMFDESGSEPDECSIRRPIAMDIADVMEGYENYDDAMEHLIFWMKYTMMQKNTACRWRKNGQKLIK